MIGAVFKIQSWEGGEYFLLPGMILFPIAILCVLVVKLLRSRRVEDTLELDDRRARETGRNAEKVAADDNKLML